MRPAEKVEAVGVFAEFFPVRPSDGLPITVAARGPPLPDSGAADPRFIVALGSMIADGDLGYAAGYDLLMAAALRDGLWDGEADDIEDRLATKLADAAMAHLLGPPQSPPAARRHLAPPEGIASRMTVRQARRRLSEAMADFFRQMQAVDPKTEAENAPLPIVHGIRLDVGVGKSAVARFMAAKALAEMRACGDRRTITLAVPTLALGDEQARAFETLPEAKAHGLRAAVWRGRKAPDPDAAGKTMCRDLEAVRDAQSVGATVESSVCRKDDGTVCPFYGACGYQRQKRAEADLWIVAHEMIYMQKPDAIGNVAVLVVDEAAWQDGLIGVDGKPDDLTLDTLRAEVAAPKGPSGLASAELREVHRILRSMLDSLPDGPLERASVAEHISRETAAAGLILTWRRKLNPGLLPGMTAAERRAKVRAAAGNRDVLLIARMLHAILALLADDGPEASGWLSLVTRQTEDGPVRAIRLRGRRKIGKGWQVPTLILDALLDARLIAPYWPQIEVTAAIEVATPHMRVRQMTGRGADKRDWSKSALVPADDCADDAERKRRAKNSARVRAVVLREARAAGGRALVVAQQAVEDQWRAMDAPWPGHVDLAHHNAVAGRDEWGPGPDREGVASLIVVGRALPKPGDVERMAEALTGRAVSERVSRYERREAPIEMRDSTTAPGEADRHPDPIAEAIRWQICEGELIQIIGRGRGVNRTAADPLDVLILTNRPLPLPVDEMVAWDALEPSPADLMLAAGGVALENHGDMAAAYPDLWPSREAAKKAAKRGQMGTNPYTEIPNGKCPHLLPATYRRAVERVGTAALTFDPAVTPDIRAWLEMRLGPLAACEAEAPQPAAARKPAAETARATAPQQGQMEKNPIRDVTSPAASRIAFTKAAAVHGKTISVLFGPAEPWISDIDEWSSLPEPPPPTGPGLLGTAAQL